MAAVSAVLSGKPPKGFEKFFRDRPGSTPSTETEEGKKAPPKEEAGEKKAPSAPKIGEHHKPQDLGSLFRMGSGGGGGRGGGSGLSDQEKQVSSLRVLHKSLHVFTG